MPVFSVLCVLVQFYYGLSASLSPLQPFFFLSFGYTPLSGFVIGFCPVISDNEDGSCLCDWIVTEHESSQFSCLASAKLAAALHHSVCFPSAPDHVSLVQFYCSVLALPLSLCLLSASFRLPFCLDTLPRLALGLVCVP